MVPKDVFKFGFGVLTLGQRKMIVEDVDSIAVCPLPEFVTVTIDKRLDHSDLFFTRRVAEEDDATKRAQLGIN